MEASRDRSCPSGPGGSCKRALVESVRANTSAAFQLIVDVVKGND